MFKYKGQHYRLKKPAIVVLLIVFLLVASGITFLIHSVLSKSKLNTDDYGNINNVTTTDLPSPVHGEDYAMSNEDFIVKVFDVGQGSAMLVDYGDTEVLIDGGYHNDENIHTLLESKNGLSKYVTDGTIEYIIATHSHADHIGCLPEVIEKYNVGKIIYGDLFSETAEVEYLIEAAQIKGVELTEDSDTVITLGKNASLTIFDVYDHDKNDINANSVVTLIQYGDTYFFSDGDLPAEQETLLRGKLPRCDVVIAGHHGSADSNSLLDELTPEYFVISCGKAAKEGTKQGNVYGYPHEEVLSQAISLNASCLGTWKSGNITFKSDGMSVTCSEDASKELTLDDAGAKGKKK